MNLRMTEIDHILLRRIYKSLVVDVDGALRNREKRALTDEVFEKEIAEVIRSCLVKRKRVWKK